MSAAFPLGALRAPLAPDELANLRATLTELLCWHVDLAHWPAPAFAPDATPIVSLYLDGRLVGCSGTTDGAPPARLARAFVQTLGDQRFGGVAEGARRRIVAELSYPRAPRPVSKREALEQLEVGRHGLALVTEGGGGSLLPDVASEYALGPADFLQALAEKSGVPLDAWPADGLFLFETSRVVARLAEAPPPLGEPVAAAASWLARRVGEGDVDFGFDPRTGTGVDDPPMFHGRVAVLLRALLAQRSERGAAARAKRWLEAELARGLAGDRRVALPDSLPVLAGTLALASLAGIDCDPKLVELASAPELAQNPWHAAQVVTALGPRAPEALYRAVVERLDADPFAPWTLMAATARGDTPVIARAAAALARLVRTGPPHEGGVGPIVPETARTAAVVEALAPVAATPEERAAVVRARAFITAQQLSGADYAPAAAPARVTGAFPVSPVVHFLQLDVTAHALLALVVR